MATIQVGIIYSFYYKDFLTVVVDSLVVSILHAFIGLAVWYPVRFNQFEKRNFILPLLNLVLSGVLIVFIWTGLSYFLLKYFFAAQEPYIEFLKSSIPNRIITDVLLFAVLVLIYSLIIYNNNLREKIESEMELRSLVKEAQLDLLKTQINPHFLFNALNSITHLIKSKPDEARAMVIKLSEFLRYSLKFTENQTIELHTEVENMERYLDIEKIRFQDKILFKTKIGKNTEDCLIPNMILQPLIENAVKHGVYESTELIKIVLETEIKSGMLEILLENDFDPGVISQKGEGIGLKNIRERLKLIYGRPDLLIFEKREKLFSVRLIIPQS